MMAIVNTAPDKVELQQVPLPVPGPGQVRIRTAACGICATDLAMIAGWERTGFPAIPGHEWSGTVDAAGAGVDAALIGMPCVAENVLSDGGEVGFEHPGGYGEYLITEARNVQLLPTTFPLATAALIEPLAVCVRGWNRLKLHDRNGVLIFGDGPIGLLLVMLLHHHGVKRICLVGGRPGRLQLARELGAAVTLNYHELTGALPQAVLAALDGPVPNVIEASGSAAASEAALLITTVGGKVLLLGDYDKACAAFPWNRVLHRELELIGSCASANAWPEAVRLATSGALPLERLISHRLPARDYEKGLDLVRNCREAMKVVLLWENRA